MLETHRNIEEEYLNKLENEIPLENKKSPIVLNSIKMMKELAKKGDYKGANKLKDDIIKKEKDDREKYLTERNKKIENKLNFIKQKHHKELTAVKNTIDFNISEMINNRDNDIKIFNSRSDIHKFNIKNTHCNEYYKFDKNNKEKIGNNKKYKDELKFNNMVLKNKNAERLVFN